MTSRWLLYYRILYRPPPRPGSICNLEIIATYVQMVSIVSKYMCGRNHPPRPQEGTIEEVSSYLKTTVIISGSYQALKVDTRLVAREEIMHSVTDIRHTPLIKTLLIGLDTPTRPKCQRIPYWRSDPRRNGQKDQHTIPPSMIPRSSLWRCQWSDTATNCQTRRLCRELRQAIHT